MREINFVPNCWNTNYIREYDGSTRRTRMPMEIGTMESVRLGEGTAMPVLVISKDIPATALITLTAGVNNPSAMTKLAPNKVHRSNPTRKTLEFPIHEPLTGRPLKSDVESSVSVTVSIRVSGFWLKGECLSRLR
jgi:hypothetical protein